MRRSYAGGAVTTTIISPITTSSPNAVLNSADGWPDTSGGPFAAVIDRGTVTEEKILISDRSGTSITFSARGYDGTVAQNHSASATIEHIATAIDHDEANAHVNTSTGVHGVTGSVVGTSGAQTLLDKTVSGPLADFDSLRRAGFEVATRLGTETLQNKTLNSPTVTGTAQMAAVQADSVSVGGDQVVTRLASQVVENKTIKNSTIENSTLVSAGLDAGSTSDGAEIVNISKAQTLVNKTLTSPTLNTPALVDATGSLGPVTIDVGATVNGDPIARRRFLPKYATATSPSSGINNVDLVSIGYSTGDGMNTGDTVEVFFTWPRINISSGSGIVAIRLWTSIDSLIRASEYRVVASGVSFVDGGTIHSVFEAPSANYTIWANIVYTSGTPTGTVFASSEAPMTLSVRPFFP